MTKITPEGWHARFQQQAGWTRELRRHLFDQIGIRSDARILEAGCGTGAVLAEVAVWGQRSVFGLDLSSEYLHLACKNVPGARLTCGDAHALPYASGIFDVTYCHFLLLWVSDPNQVVEEMKRVTRRGGWVMLLAEPDYGGRIDYPQELESIGKLQNQALHRQGADLEVGRRLHALLANAGLKLIQGGALGGWTSAPMAEDWKMEWKVFRDDLRYLQPGEQPSLSKIDDLQNADRKAWMRGERVLFVPTFYAWGKK